MLVPCDIFPPMDGNSMNIYHTIKYVSQRNRLQVLLSHVFSQGGEVDIFHPNLDINYCPPTWFDRFKYKSFLFNPYYYQAAYELLNRTKADVIQCQVLYTAPAGYLLKRRFKKPLVLVQENVEYLKYRRFGAPAPLTYFLNKLEEASCRMADKIVAVSVVDKEFMREIYGLPEAKIEVIQHCADPEVFNYSEKGRHTVRRLYDLSPQELVLSFVGKLDTIPNTAAVRYIAGEIYPLVLAEHPRTTFLIIGQNYDHLLPYKKQRMIFTGFVSNRKDASPNLADYLSASDMVIVPLDSGSGTRVKILEAAACSRAIVSTEIGVEGLDFVEGTEILLSERVDEEFIGLVLGLVEDEARRKELGRQARQKVLSHYSWEGETAKYEGIYREIEGRGAATCLGKGHESPGYDL